jgi:hypothetical protein
MFWLNPGFADLLLIFPAKQFELTLVSKTWKDFQTSVQYKETRVRENILSGETC